MFEGIINFGTFLIASMVLIITPGADTLYILGRSLSQGKKAGVISALGVGTGLLVHTFFATIGLSALLARSAEAFLVVKFLGAGYLIYLGVKTLINKQRTPEVKGDAKASHNRIFVSGMLTNILNPKVALFFLAFLPQFIDPSSVGHFFSLMTLGVVFTLLGTIYCAFIAYYSALFSHKIKTYRSIKKWMDLATGVLFIGLGLKLALSKR